MENEVSRNGGGKRIVPSWVAASAAAAREMEATRCQSGTAAPRLRDDQDQKGGSRSNARITAAPLTNKPDSVSPFFTLARTEWKETEWWRRPDFWKDGNPVDVITFMEKMLGMFPSDGQRDILYELAGKDPYEWPTDYQQFNLAIGQGGGKNTYIISPFTSYTAYKIANMKDPWLYFSRFLEKPLDYGTKFEMTNSSMVTERQAKNVHFSKMQSLIRRCTIPLKNEAGKLERGTENWFTEYAKIDIRESIGAIQSKTITILTQPGCGPIVLYSFDSTASGPEGLQIILGIVDEASRADSEAAYNTMDLLWKVIIGNINTRFPRGVGKVVNFSYLSGSEYDFTYRLLQEAEEEKKTTDKPIIFAVNKSTFEMNPNVKRTDPSIEKAYRNDPIDAAARYEGIKGASKEGFYQPHVEKVRECFFEMENPVKYSFGITEREVENPKTRKMEITKFVKIDLNEIKGDNRTRGWAYDAGISLDAFILKGGYVETMDVRRDELFIDNKPEIVVMNKRPIIDIVIVWQPHDGMTVDYLNVGDILGLLIDKFPNSRFANSDKYNAENFKQQIMRKGVSSETYQFSNTQQMRLYKKLRWMIWNNIPQINADVMHNIRKGGLTKTVGEWNLSEHERLLKINDNKVDHPRDGSKDLADVDAILCNDLAELEVIATFGATGLANMESHKRLLLTERFITERDNVKKSGVPREKILAKMTEVMQMTYADTVSLNEYANQIYPQFRI